MGVIVLDASAAVELILSTNLGRSVSARLRDEPMHAPAHLDVEVGNAVRRVVRRELIDDHDGLQAIHDFLQLEIERWLAAPFLPRAYELRSTHTVADALYIALAESLDAPLVTCDTRLARSHGHEAVIEMP